MSANKKYYWLKLPKDFFQNPKIKKLRKIAGGDTYTIIYQKLMLLTLMTDGVLEYEQIEDTFTEELSLILDEAEDNVKVTMSYLLLQGLLEQLDDTLYLMSEVPKLLGSESTSAERVRRHREKSNTASSSLIKPNKSLHCNKGVTKCNTELELELELELKKDKKINKKSLVNYSDYPDVNQEASNEWFEYKKYKSKAPITKTLNFLSKYSKQVQQHIVDTSIMNGYQGLFEPKQNYSAKKSLDDKNQEVLDSVFGVDVEVVE